MQNALKPEGPRQPERRRRRRRRRARAGELEKRENS
jgi:hypothetical protein